MAGRGPEVVPCPLEERPQALGVLYQRVPGALKPRLIADAMAEAASGLIDLSGLWIARRRGRVVGALLTQTLAGKAAAVWAPEVDTVFSRDAIAVALVRAALDELKRRGFLLAQALLDESTPRRGSADLARGGLPHITDLVYLEGDTQRDITVKPHLPSFDWRPFRPETEAEFRAVLQATYIGSLDMPELEGLRSLDDVLASHRAAGRFVPERWRLGRLRGEPDAAAVLLLASMPDRDAWEVAYLGLTLAARGRGLGRAVLSHAAALARPYVPRIELAVDVRNQPAHHLYTRAGFHPFDRRAVHLALFR
jgi:mycothiol synthase